MKLFHYKNLLLETQYAKLYKPARANKVHVDKNGELILGKVKDKSGKVIGVQSVHSSRNYFSQATPYKLDTRLVSNTGGCGFISYGAGFYTATNPGIIDGYKFGSTDFSENIEFDKTCFNILASLKSNTKKILRKAMHRAVLQSNSNESSDEDKWLSDYFGITKQRFLDIKGKFNDIITKTIEDLGLFSPDSQFASSDIKFLFESNYNGSEINRLIKSLTTRNFNIELRKPDESTVNDKLFGYNRIPQDKQVYCIVALALLLHFYKSSSPNCYRKCVNQLRKYVYIKLKYLQHAMETCSLLSPKTFEDVKEAIATKVFLDKKEDEKVKGLRGLYIEFEKRLQYDFGISFPKDLSSHTYSDIVQVLNTPKVSNRLSSEFKIYIVFNVLNDLSSYRSQPDGFNGDNFNNLKNTILKELENNSHSLMSRYKKEQVFNNVLSLLEKCANGILDKLSTENRTFTGTQDNLLEYLILSHNWKNQVNSESLGLVLNDRLNAYKDFRKKNQIKLKRSFDEKEKEQLIKAAQQDITNRQREVMPLLHYKDVFAKIEKTFQNDFKIIKDRLKGKKSPLGGFTYVYFSKIEIEPGDTLPLSEEVLLSEDDYYELKDIYDDDPVGSKEKLDKILPTLHPCMRKILQGKVLPIPTIIDMASEIIEDKGEWFMDGEGFLKSWTEYFKESKNNKKGLSPKNLVADALVKCGINAMKQDMDDDTNYIILNKDITEPVARLKFSRNNQSKYEIVPTTREEIHSTINAWKKWLDFILDDLADKLNVNLDEVKSLIKNAGDYVHDNMPRTQYPYKIYSDLENHPQNEEVFLDNDNELENQKRIKNLLDKYVNIIRANKESELTDSDYRLAFITLALTNLIYFRETFLCESKKIPVNAGQLLNEYRFYL